MLENLKQTNASISTYQEMIPDKKIALFWQMTSDFGKRMMQLQIDWTEDCIQRLEKLEDEK